MDIIEMRARASIATGFTQIEYAARALHDAMAANGIGRACAYDDLTGPQKQDYRDYAAVVVNSLVDTGCSISC